MKITITPHTNPVITLDRGFTDVLKLLAAIMVAMGHYSGFALNYVENPLYRGIVMFGSGLGVNIFFFLSGYGLMMSEKRHHLSFYDFVKRRLMRVYFPVIFVSAIWGIVIWPNGEGIDHLPAYLKLVFITFGDGILWFIRVIAAMYLFFYGYTLIRQHKLWRLPILALGTAFAYSLVYLWVANWAAISVPIFTLGIILVEYNEHIYKMAHGWGIGIWAILITTLMFILYLLYGNLYVHAWINYFVITCIVMLCAYRNIVVSVPQWVGGISYDIYLTHNKVINLLKPVLGYIPLHLFLVGTIITSVASYSLRIILKL